MSKIKEEIEIGDIVRNRYTKTFGKVTNVIESDFMGILDEPVVSVEVQWSSATYCDPNDLEIIK